MAEVKKSKNTLKWDEAGKCRYYDQLFSIAKQENEFNDQKMRKSLLERVPFEDVVRYARGYFAKGITDEELPEKIKRKLGSHQKNTGIYLWMHGYAPLKCLGVGKNGVVWLCESGGKKEAVKVTCDRKIFGIIPVTATADEIRDSEVLESIIKNKKEDASKYLFLTERDQSSDEEGKSVFKSKVADKGNLAEYKSSKNGYDRFLEILNTGINVLQGLKILHDGGYSHNDVKPDNILAITNTSKADVQRLDNSEKGDEVVAKLADFGCITRINSKFHQKIIVNRYFCPPDIKNIKQEAVAKRDVYSLGATLLYLLIDRNVSNAKKWAKKLENSRDLYEFCNIKRDKSLLVGFGCFADPKKADKFIAFLRGIQ